MLNLSERLTAHRFRHFSGEIFFFFFDTFADGKADISRKLDGRTDFTSGVLNGLLDGDVRVHDEGLLHQADFLVELVHPANDHLFDHVVWLT